MNREEMLKAMLDAFQEYGKSQSAWSLEWMPNPDDGTEGWVIIQDDEGKMNTLIVSIIEGQVELIE